MLMSQVWARLTKGHDIGMEETFRVLMRQESPAKESIMVARRASSLSFIYISTSLSLYLSIYFLFLFVFFLSPHV